MREPRGAMNSSRVPGLTRNSGWVAAMAAARQSDQTAEPVRDHPSTRSGADLIGGPLELRLGTTPERSTAFRAS